MVSPRAELYDDAYSHYASGLYREVRVATYGADFGQTSWVTTAESEQIPELLGLLQDSFVLEIGCGSGGYAVKVVEQAGCSIVGLDINESGVRNANDLASSRGVASRAHFEQCDGSKQLAFGDKTFDAAFANDVLCHIPGRLDVLCELFRVLKPGARLLFSDALVIAGMVSHEEIAARSLIGYYMFSPPGENERLLAQAGFSQICVSDTTENAARISERWRLAREQRREALIAAEGHLAFERLQRFLACVQALTDERRLRRFLYVAAKDSD